MNRTSKTAAAAAIMSLSALALAAKSRPNIIFFLIDDYGWPESSVAYGEEVYPRNLEFKTPNMERLARKGVMLTQAYACPVSTPTRSSIMSGMNAVHSHITNWTSMAKDEPSDAVGGKNGAAVYEELETDIFRRPEWNINGLCPDGPLSEGVNDVQIATPVARLLRDGGYYTIHVGKAHWSSAGTPGSSPYNMGFLINIAGTNAGLPKSYLGTDNYGNKPELWNMSAVQNMTEYYGTETFLTEALTREALKTLEWPVSHNQPFYLYLAHYATHTPVQKDDRFFKEYKDMGLDNGKSKFSSMVAGVDKSLGDILDYLDEKGIADNTIIIFMADNGGNADVKSKGGVPHTQCLPLREGKGSCYQGGIRVPMMVYWPGKTAAGTRINTPVCPEDLFPTLLEMGGVKDAGTVQPVDGKSIVPLVTKGSQYVSKAVKKGLITNQKEANRFVVPESVSGIDPQRPLFFHYPHQWKVTYKPEVDFLSTVIVGDWKLVYVMMNTVPGQSVQDGVPFELYNIKEDIGETRNLAAERPDKVEELARILGERLREWNASMPVVRSTGLPVPWPDDLLTACADRLKTGDLVFVGIPMDYTLDEGSMDSAIAASTGDGALNLIHTAIAEVEGDKIWIIDATLRHGVDRHPLDTFLCDFTLKDGSLPEFIIMRLKDPKNASQFVENAKQFLGQPYDKGFLPDNGAMYCTELVRESYVLDGEYVFGNKPMNFKGPDGEFPVYWQQLFSLIGQEIPQDIPGTNPQDMAKSEKLRRVTVRIH